MRSIQLTVQVHTNFSNQTTEQKRLTPHLGHTELQNHVVQDAVTDSLLVLLLAFLWRNGRIISHEL